jgi:hypothetical protein
MSWTVTSINKPDPAFAADVLQLLPTPQQTERHESRPVLTVVEGSARRVDQRPAARARRPRKPTK